MLIVEQWILARLGFGAEAVRDCSQLIGDLVDGTYRIGRMSCSTAPRSTSRWGIDFERDWRFFSLAELDVAIRALINELNDRLTRKLGVSRRAFLETIDRPTLMSLPASMPNGVGPDNQAEVYGHFYSCRPG